jgi:cysteinyl-tRNA synthetase
MSLGLLGDGFDLHCGGLDLAFPHHENERAQAVALGRAFARHWTHNGFVEVDGEKMSKSLGNFTSLTDLLERSDSRAYRLLVLRSHYRSPIEVTPSTVADAEAALARLDNLARRFRLGPELCGGTVVTLKSAIEAGADARALSSFAERMEDDLDTPAAVALVFDLAKRANESADRGDTENGRESAVTAALICAALGLCLRAGIDEEPDEEISALVERRDAARAAGNWALADDLRDEIKERGWILKDSPDGTRLHRE